MQGFNALTVWKTNLKSSSTKCTSIYFTLSLPLDLCKTVSANFFRKKLKTFFIQCWVQLLVIFQHFTPFVGLLDALVVFLSLTLPKSWLFRQTDTAATCLSHYSITNHVFTGLLSFTADSFLECCSLATALQCSLAIGRLSICLSHTSIVAIWIQLRSRGPYHWRAPLSHLLSPSPSFLSPKHTALLLLNDKNGPDGP